MSSSGKPKAILKKDQLIVGYMGIGSRQGGRGPPLDFHTWYRYSR